MNVNPVVPIETTFYVGVVLEPGYTTTLDDSFVIDTLKPPGVMILPPLELLLDELPLIPGGMMALPELLLD